MNGRTASVWRSEFLPSGYPSLEPEVWLIRHGETDWSITGQHSGRHDLPLTPTGEHEAQRVGRILDGRKFNVVLCSPLQRAARTCQISGYGSVALIEPDTQEWDYGDCTGKTEGEMREQFPGWTLWDGPIPNGETIEDVAARASRSVARVRQVPGRVAIFSHGHFLRVFVTQWLGLPPQAGRHFALETGSVCILGEDAEFPAIRKWNAGAADLPNTT